MIIYSVTSSVMIPREQEWVKWMAETHIPEMMDTGFFTEFHFSKLLDPQPEGGVSTYNVQYMLDNFSDYHYYITQKAPILREKHKEAFGAHVVSFRTVLKRMET